MSTEVRNIYARYRTDLETMETEALKDEIATEKEIKFRIARMNKVAAKSLLPNFKQTVFSYRKKE